MTAVVSTRTEKGFASEFLAGVVYKAASQRKRIVLPESTDVRVLTALGQIINQDFCTPLTLGNVDEINAVKKELGIDLDLDQLEIIDLHDAKQSDIRDELVRHYHAARRHKGISLNDADAALESPAVAATMLVRTARADGLVSGAVHTTADTIRPALQLIGTAGGTDLVSSVFLMLLDDHALVFGDCAVNPHPDAEQLARIARDSAATAREFGIDPRVAILSYSTSTSGAGPTVETVTQAVEHLRVQAPELPVAGPIQFDAAVHPEIGAHKLPGSKVAGRATVLIFPDLNAGNITYKAVQQTAGAVAVGPILQGLAKPVNDLSRGCTVTDIVTTAAVTAVQAQHLGKH